MKMLSFIFQLSHTFFLKSYQTVYRCLVTKWCILFKKLSNSFHSNPNDCFSHFTKKEIKKVFLNFPSIFEILGEPELLSIYLTMRLQREGLIGLECIKAISTNTEANNRQGFFPQNINLLHHSAKIATFSHGSFSQGLVSQCLKPIYIFAGQLCPQYFLTTESYWLSLFL